VNDNIKCSLAEGFSPWEKIYAHRILLIAFLMFAGVWYLGQFLYFCKRCRLYDCPFNRVTL